MVAVSLRSPFKTLLLVSALFVFAILFHTLHYTPSIEPVVWPPEPRDVLNNSMTWPDSDASRPDPKYAVATFLTHDDHLDWDRSDAQNDMAFIGARLLTYQLLYANETRIRDPAISFIVLITSTVSAAKRQQLLLDGATLVDVEMPPLPAWLEAEPTLHPYAGDQLAKLNLFALEEYDRVLFINPDAFLTRPIDGIFSDHSLIRPSTTLTAQRPKQVKWDKSLLPTSYIFAARTDTSIATPNDPYWHGFPPPGGDVFRMSTVLFAPSLQIYDLLLYTLHSKKGEKIMKRFRRDKWRNRWMRNAGPEVALLNHIFRREGTMPWTDLDPKWGSSWGNQKDITAEVACLNGEFWWSGPLEIRSVWVDYKAKMEGEFA